MASIDVHGSSTARGLWDLEYGGFANRLQVGYMQRPAANENERLVHVYNLGMCEQLVDETCIAVAERAAKRQRLNHTGRVINIFVTGAMESAISVETGQERMARPMFRETLRRLGQVTQEAGSYGAIYLGPTRVAEEKTNPLINEGRIGDRFINSLRMDYGTDIENHVADLQRQSANSVRTIHIPLWDAITVELLAHDGLHPRDEGARIIAANLEPRIDTMLMTGNTTSFPVLAEPLEEVA